MSAEDEAAPASNLYRLVAGEDDQRRALSVDAAGELGDVFSREVLLKGKNPLTLRALNQAISEIANPALPLRKMFLVAEGAQFAAAGTPFELNARLLFTWQASASKPPDLLLSTVAAADDPRALLQLIAWSERDQAFHFFERERSGGAWTWAGNSFHALKPPTRGQGPFDSHVNGGLVMKELKAPWIHWHSMNASIPRALFGADSEFNHDPLFASLDGAQNLESIVRNGVRRWTKGRFAAQLVDGVLRDLPDYLRQLLWCTSVNLASSRDGFLGNEPQFDLPTSFFFDIDAIDSAARQLDPPADVVPPTRLSVDAALYRRALAARNVAVLDDSPDARRVAGDTHFAFLVPERAFEDVVIVNELVARQVLSPRLALSLLLVDFSNPLFSPARAALLRHVPERIGVGDRGAALDRAFSAAVRGHGTAAGSPEAAWLGLWETPDLGAHAAALLAAYQDALAARLQTEAGVADLVALAESRREAVRRTRSLAEFHSTFAQGEAPPPHLAMAPDATVFTKGSTEGEGEF